MRYNWPMYALATAGVVVGAAAAAIVPMEPILRTGLAAVVLVAALATAWTVLAAYLAYDASRLHRWDWLPDAGHVGHWTNIHAGLDEASLGLAAAFPKARRAVLDVYDAAAMTEPAIRVARRRITQAPPATACRFDALPLEDAATDLVMLFFVAHELRGHDDRVRLFREAGRILRPDGRIVVVEHLCDGWNFLAFGPGALHFLPMKAWRATFADASLSVVHQTHITPWLNVFELRGAA